MNNRLEKNNAAHAVEMRGRSRIVRGLLAVIALTVIGAFASPAFADAAFSAGNQTSENANAEGVTVYHASLGGVLGLSSLAMMGGIRDKGREPGEGNGGGGDELDPAARKIMAELEQTRSKMAEIEANLADNPELKKYAEDVAAATRGFDGLTDDYKKLQTAHSKLEKKLNNVRREVSGDPLERILQNDELRASIASLVKVPLLKKNSKEVPAEMLESYRSLTDGLKTGAQSRAVGTGSAPGSNLISSDLLPNIYQLIAMYGVNREFDVIPTSTLESKLITDTTDPEMLGVDDGGTIPESTYANAVTSVNMEIFAGLLTLSNSFIEDDETALARRIVEKFTRATAKRADFIGLTADGTDDGPNKNQTGAVEAGTAFVCASGNTSFATIDYDDFTNLFLGAAEALAGSDRARIFIHPQNLFHLLSIKDSNGRAIFLNALEAPAPGAIGSIMGIPVIRSYVMPTTDGTSKPFLAFGDAKAMALGIRRDLQFASSSDVAFKSDSTVFRATARMGSKLRLATAFEIMTTAAS